MTNPRPSRHNDFQTLTTALSSSARLTSPCALLLEGDSLHLLRKMPDHCISLILTDPPYHTTKKRNIYGDTAFEEDSHYLDWMAKFVVQWKRVLRPNGSLFCFCAPEMAARLEVLFATEFNILSHIVWTKPNDPGFDGWKQKMRKEALRQWYAHSERIIFAEPACEGNLHNSPLAHFLHQTRQKAGMSTHDLAEAIGAYGRVNHGGAVSNWEAGRNTPSREQYAKLSAALFATGRIEPMPPYEDVTRPFTVDATKEFTDVWTFPSVRPYEGKHPAEKPVPMLAHAIQATTFPGDIVLDCFAGSGNTAFAALDLGRRSVSMEADPLWVSRIAARLQVYDTQMWQQLGESAQPALEPPSEHPSRQAPLFSNGNLTGSTIAH